MSSYHCRFTDKDRGRELVFYDVVDRMLTLAERMIQFYIQSDNEERILYYANEYTKRWGEDLNHYVVDYYISKERYQDAVDYSSDSVWRIYDSLYSCIKDLMRKHKKDDAIKLIKTNSYLFNLEKSDSEYYKPTVIKKLTALTKE